MNEKHLLGVRAEHTANADQASAIVEAKRSGSSIVEIADASGLRTQQVEQVIAGFAPDAVKALREEVMDSGSYAHMLEDDQAHVDHYVHQLANPVTKAPEPEQSVEESIVAVNMETSGLGNRVHFTLGVASVAAATGRDLQVYWPLDKLFQCPVGSIWANFPGEIVEARELPPIGPDMLTDWRNLTPESWSTNDDPAVYLRGYGGIPQPVGSRHWGDLFRELELTSEVRGLVEKAWDELPRDAGVLGVSMRVNELSHPKTKEHSPTEWYVAELERFSTTHPNSGIFLSCDEAAVTERLMAQFPNIVAIDYPGEYNSARSVIKAVADLYILASATQIISPHWSSFPNMSYQLAAEQVPMRNSMRSWPGAKGAIPSIASNPVWPSQRRIPVADWLPFS